LHQNIDALSLHIQGEAKKDIDAGRPEAVVFDRKFFPEYPATNFLNIPDKRTLRNLLFLRLHPDKTTMLNGVNVFVFLFKLADELYKFYYDSTNPEIQIGNDDGKYVMPFLLASYNPSWKVRANMLWQEYLNKNAAEEADRKAKEEEERAQRAREEARKQQREEREREAREEAERQRREKEEREEARKQQREQKAKEAAQFISALDEGLKTIHSLKDQKLYQIMVDGAYYNAIHCIDSQISVSQYMMWAFVETFLKQCFVLINNKTITASETQIAALESLKKIVSQSHIGIDLSEDFKTNFTKRIKQFDDIRKDLKKEKEQKPNRESK
jgi:Skp family chaperone for outer membrane proteins